MSFTAFALVVAAAILHALWNLTAKQVSGNMGVFWLGLCFASTVLAPFALYFGWQGIDAAGLPYVIATGLIHAFYFSLLGAAYRHGEMSVVYPLARGTGVAGTGLVAWALIGERVSALGALGIGSVCQGILFLGLRELRRPGNSRSYLLAVLVGVSITAYSVVDKVGVGLVSPVVYIAGLAAGSAVFSAPYVLLNYRRECREAWRNQKGASAWIGLGSMGTYLLILWAFQQARVSYVVAVR